MLEQTTKRPIRYQMTTGTSNMIWNSIRRLNNILSNTKVIFQIIKVLISVIFILKVIQVNLLNLKKASNIKSIQKGAV